MTVIVWGENLKDPCPLLYYLLNKNDNMNNIFDYIKESLLDDVDSLENKTDNIILKGWFDEYAKGDFKVKISKKGITKVTGNMIIRGFDGEKFPTMNIDEFKGSLTIERCPNLISTEGLFKDYFYKIYGNLIINNCPKLTTLKCPTTVEGNFQLVGNSSLKSLEGAPEMVTDEVYIMKNGKKFKEEQIKQYIPFVGDFICCSEEGEEADVNEAQIDEAFSNPYLMLLNKQLNEQGYKFLDVFRSNYAWDQIDSSHIQNCNWRFKKPSDKDLKAARAIISGKIDGLILVYYYENNKIVFEYAIDSNKMYTRLNKKSRYIRWESVKSTELIDMICGNLGYSTTDGMLIIKHTSDIKTYKKQNDRYDSRVGMVKNTPEYYAKIARENIARYKKIIQTNRANRNTGEVEKVQKMVDAFLKDIMQASQNVMKNPMKYKDELLWLEKLNEFAYDRKRYDRGSSWGRDGVLVLFNTYMEIWTKTATGEETYIHGDANERLTLLQEQIRKIIEDAQHYLNKFDV